MKNALICLSTALALLGSGSVSAQQTGNDLMKWIEAERRVVSGRSNGTSDWYQAGLLAGFVMGVANTLDSEDDLVCLPSKSTMRQWLMVTVQYLEANPEDLHKSQTELAIAAFRKAFPCRKP